MYRFDTVTLDKQQNCSVSGQIVEFRYSRQGKNFMRKTLEVISLGALAGTVAGFIATMRRVAHAKSGS